MEDLREQTAEFLSISSGDGYSYGSGYSYGIKAFNGWDVHIIDGTQTIIRAVRGNAAKGMILGSDLTLTKCYIVRQGNTFAHGETVEKAFEALRDKLFEDMPAEERAAAFWAVHKRGVKYPAKDYYEWHHKLTGSCEMGRDQFVRDGGFDLENDSFTPEEFIEITKDAYGGEVVRLLAEAITEDE